MPVEKTYGSYADYFAAVREKARKQAEREKDRVAAGNSPWETYDTPIFWLDKMGESVTLPFKPFLQQRREQKGKVFVMDVMGTGGFMDEEYPVDGEVAITLVDFRNEEQVRKDDLRKKRVVAGDVSRRSPWRKANNFINQNDDTAFPGFDLITCKPLAGWGVLRGSDKETTPHGLLTEWLLFNNMFQSLSPSGGTLIVNTLGAYDYGRWIERLQRTDGIDADSNGVDVLTITKRESPRGLLPKIVFSS